MPCLTESFRSLVTGTLRPIIRSAGFGLAAWLFYSPLAAAATDKNCLATWEKPVTEINLTIAKPTYNRNKSAKQIERVAKKSGYIKPKGHGRLLGLTHASFSPSIRVGTRYEEIAKGRFCLRLTKVFLTFGIQKTEIYIDRKYRKNTCAYKEILAHEQEHVRINEEVVAAYVPKVSKILEKQAAKIRPFLTSDPDKAMQSIINRLYYDLNPTFKEFGDDRENANEVIDSRASYEATREKCNDW